MGSITQKTMLDGAGAPFPAYFFDDGSGALSSLLPCPTLTTGSGSSLAAKSGAGRLSGIQASNSSLVDEGYVIALDLATPPSVNATISPKKFWRIDINNGSTDGTADINAAFAFAVGLVVVLSKSLSTYTPGTMSGQINASFF